MENLKEALQEFFSQSDHPVLFCGAGVSARAGIVTWVGLLDRLSESIRAKDPLTAQMMKEMIHEGNYLLAADYFDLTPKVTEGRKNEAIKLILQSDNHQLITSLIKLPCKGIYTTNYDRVLLNAYASVNNASTIDFRRGDEAFKHVIWETKDFVARIHGCIESPSSMVLNTKSFESLNEDIVYQDILTDIFTKKNILFIGVSFEDPAIKSIFNTINKIYGAAPKGRHLALLPEDLDNSFLNKFSRMNIEVVRYDPSNHHESLWEAINSYTTESTIPLSKQTISQDPAPFSAAKHYLASCYARMRLNGRIHPLRQAVIEGIVSSIIQDSHPKSVQFSEIIQKVHTSLGIHIDEIKPLVVTALEALSEDKLCQINKTPPKQSAQWVSTIDDKNNLNAAIDILVENITNRAFVQEGLKPSRDIRLATDEFLRNLIFMRGWDLGASFAGNLPLHDIDISKLLYQSCQFISHAEIEKLTRACKHLISSPTNDEAKLLAELGRASFALELAIQCPRNVLFHSDVLPEKVYLDANVLMPALTYGHPYFNIYRNTIDRLRDAATRSGSIQILAYYGFLNEIVSHRRLAIQQSEEAGSSFNELIVKEAIMYGTSTMNVFIGAYANVSLQEPELNFLDYLKQYAPYSTENELAIWIRLKGISVIKDKDINSSEKAKISFELQKSYASSLETGKPIGLIDHDAMQLSSLYSDIQSNKKAIFVTADKKLSEKISIGPYQKLSEYMITHIGLTQMIDLLVGNLTDSRGLTELIWTAKSSSKTEEVRQYLTTLALQEYDEALIMEMPKVVEKIAEELTTEASRVGIKIDSDNPNERIKFLKFAGHFEDKFFSAIREKIEKRQGDN